MKPERRENKKWKRRPTDTCLSSLPSEQTPRESRPSPRELATQQEKDDHKHGAWCCPGSTH